MTKATLRCVAFKQVRRGPLCGYASITIDDLAMTIHGVGIFVGDHGAWASPPTQPMVKGGVLLKGDDGKIRYSPPLIEFRNSKIRKAWSDRVVEAVQKFDPRALDGGA